MQQLYKKLIKNMVSLKEFLTQLELNNSLESDATILLKNDWHKIESSLSDEVKEKLQVLDPDAIYCFNNQPLILFYDFTANHIDVRKEVFHQQVWCFDKAPIVFALTINKVYVYNAFQYNRDRKELQEITGYSFDEIIEKFNYWKLQSGETWDWLADEVYNSQQYKYRVNQILFENVKQLKKALINSPNNNLTESDATNLMLRLIFTRYLIDRDVRISPFINGEKTSDKRENFNSLLNSKEELFRLFEHLKERFNFNDLFSKNLDINDHQCELISYIFKGKWEQGKMYQFMFDIFDFDIIPVEIISGIYESVLNKDDRNESSAIYTPSFLVDFLFAKTVDRHLENDTICKILDPACGSGIFLVQAYRRMVYKIPVLERTKDKLIKIASENLFGIDRDVNALNVAVFSIYVAILDFISPIEITDVKLPKLKGYNLFRNDFFNEENELFDNDLENFDAFTGLIAINRDSKPFDFIIGNPPWGSKNKPLKDRLHIKYIANRKAAVSNYEISQSFILRSRDFVSINHTICAFVISSKSFHNADAGLFRNFFFTNYLVESFFDLSIVRKEIFPGADYPATVVICKPVFNDKEVVNNIFEHISIKPSLYLSKFRLPIIADDDIKYIKQTDVINNDWFLKAALYSNYYDFAFIQRLKSASMQPTIKKFLLDNKNTIYSGDGIKRGKEGRDEPKREYIGKYLLHSKRLVDFYTPIGKNHVVFSEQDVFLERARSKELFLGEQILLRYIPKNEEAMFVSYSDKGVVFEQGLRGISSVDEVDKLKALYGIFISKLYNYFMFQVASAWGVDWPNIRLEEMFSFSCGPAIKSENLISNSSNLINLFKNKGKEESFLEIIETPNQVDKNLVKINEEISRIYKLSDLEEALIDYMHTISRYYFRGIEQRKYYARRPSEEEYVDYAKVFYHHFKSLLESDETFLSVQIYILRHTTAMWFNIGTEKPEKIISFVQDSSESKILSWLGDNFSLNEMTKNIYVKRKIMGFEKQAFFIIKPHQIRSWHRAIAYHDVSDFENAMLQADMHRIKEGGAIYV